MAAVSAYAYQPYVCLNCLEEDDHFTQHCMHAVCYKCLNNGHTSALCGVDFVRNKPKGKMVLKCPYGKDCWFQEQCNLYHDSSTLDPKKKACTKFEGIKKARKVQMSKELNKAALKMLDQHVSSMRS